MSSEKTEGFSDDLPPFTREQEDEILLTFLSAEIAGMDQVELSALHRFARNLNPGSVAEERVIALIDGQLALREIQGLE